MISKKNSITDRNKLYYSISAIINKKIKKQLMIKTNRHAITTIHNMKNQLNINFKIIKKTVKTSKIMIWKKNLI